MARSGSSASYQSTASSVSLGTVHSCALLSTGNVFCWGYNSNGELGQDNVAWVGRAAGEMSALNSVDLGTGRTAQAVTAGGYHSCAVLDDGVMS